MNVYKNWMLTSLLLLLPTLGYSAEPLLLDEIVVRGSRVPSNEENLNIREVRESPARDIGEALQNIPGVSAFRKGAIANDIVLRGLQRDNINVLMDGVRVHGGCPSRPSTLTLPRSNRSRLSRDPTICAMPAASAAWSTPPARRFHPDQGSPQP
jgi:hypothetical protein